MQQDMELNLARTELDVATLRRLFRYDAETGILYWRPRTAVDCPKAGERQRWNGRYAGDEAFRLKPNGYKEGMIFRVGHKAHRVAWAIYYGAWPQGQIDHINGDRADNRIVNLRTVTRSANCRNTKHRANNTTGRIGVSRRGHGWRATITHGRQIELGRFLTFAEAVKAREQAEILYGYHENHGRKETTHA